MIPERSETIARQVMAQQRARVALLRAIDAYTRTDTRYARSLARMRRWLVYVTEGWT